MEKFSEKVGDGVEGWFYIFVKITYLILSTINICEAVFSECRLSTSMSLLEMKWNFASQNKAGVRNAKAGTLNNWCLTNFVVAFFLSLSKRNNAPVTLMTSIITVQKAIFLSAIHTILYVGVLYVRDASRPSPIKNKDYPSVIRARILAVAVAVLISVFLNRYVIENARNVGQRTGIPEWDAILGGWGEWKPDLKRTLNGFLLTALLFLGPLVEKFWIEEDWRYARADIQASMTSLTGWRNFIIVFPTTCLCSLIQGSGVRGDCVPRMHYSTVPHGRSTTAERHICHSIILRFG